MKQVSSSSRVCFTVNSLFKPAHCLRIIPEIALSRSAWVYRSSPVVCGRGLSRMMWPHGAGRLLSTGARWRVSCDGGQMGLQAGEDGVYEPRPRHQIPTHLLHQPAEEVACPRRHTLHSQREAGQVLMQASMINCEGQQAQAATPCNLAVRGKEGYWIAASSCRACLPTHLELLCVEMAAHEGCKQWSSIATPATSRMCLRTCIECA